MKRFLMSITILLFLCSSSYATVIFSDDFEGDLTQWTGKGEVPGAHNGLIVPDPDPLQADNALIFTDTNSGGDIFTSEAAFAAGTYWLSFDYLGFQENSGGYVGISNGFPGGHQWLWATGTVSGAADVLIEDAQWHHYTFEFTAGYDFHLMLEDFYLEGYPGIDVAGDAVFDNISLSDTAPVPEPATMVLFGIGLLGLAGVSRRKR